MVTSGDPQNDPHDATVIFLGPMQCRWCGVKISRWDLYTKQHLDAYERLDAHVQAGLMNWFADEVRRSNDMTTSWTMYCGPTNQETVTDAVYRLRGVLGIPHPQRR